MLDGILHILSLVNEIIYEVFRDDFEFVLIRLFVVVWLVLVVIEGSRRVVAKGGVPGVLAVGCSKNLTMPTVLRKSANTRIGRTLPDNRIWDVDSNAQLITVLVL